MQKYKVVLSYDGTYFSGWQVQPNRPTVQGSVENALRTLFNTEVSVVGAGRTDVGVHAVGQVAHFSLARPLKSRELLAILNRMLPPSIRIRSVTPIFKGFHARYQARKKTYRYSLHLHPLRNPFTAPYSTCIPHSFDVELLKRAIPLFVGKRDFTSFANATGEVTSRSSIDRTLYAIRCLEQGEGIHLDFTGDGFAYKMVRNLVSTLLEVASRKRTVASIPLLFLQKDRRAAPPPAPSKGLFLLSVEY